MVNKKFSKRKNIRLQNYDYSQAGYYFITLCTEKKRKLLWSDILPKTFPQSNIGATSCCPQLSDIGEFIEQALKSIITVYPNIFIDDYVIMPNHIHFILVIEQPRSENNVGGRPMVAPTVSRVIQQLKGFVAKRFVKDGFMWQRSYYEHIIRDEEDLRLVLEYMDSNPAKWLEDEYFIEEVSL